MNKQNKKHSKTIFTARTDRSDVEIQRHYNKPSTNEINPGVESFAYVDVDESSVEVSIKENKKTKKTFRVKNPTEISLDVILPDEIDEFHNNNDFSTCNTLNKKVEDINKQLADLEKDIQYNFYDPKTKVGSNLKKYSSHLPYSSFKNPSNANFSSTTSEYFNKESPKKNDPSNDLKNEIYNYRSTLKQKHFEEKIEKRLEQLHKQKQQKSEARKDETKVESGHEPTCPLSLKIDLPEPVLKIHEMQLTAERLKLIEEGATKSTQKASSSQTSLQQIDSTTIQNDVQKPSTSKSKNTANTQTNRQLSISDVDVGVVKQLDSLLKKSTNDLDELKSLLKEYLKIEHNNKSPRSSSPNVKFKLTDQDEKKTKKKIKPRSRSSSNSEASSKLKPTDQNKKKTIRRHSCTSSNSETSLKLKPTKKIKKIVKLPPRSRSSSNSEASLTNQDVRNKQPQTTQIEQKSKVIKIKQISTKTTKNELSDISESNEVERNVFSSDKNKPLPIKKQTKSIETTYTEGPSTSKEISKPALDKQTELILNIFSKSSSSLFSSDEEKRAHIRDFIRKQPKDPIELTNPPNTMRLATPSEKSPKSPEQFNISMKPTCKKECLGIQILPALDIKRPLTIQTLPDVAIESDENFIDQNKMSSENVRYIQITHSDDTDWPKIETSETVKSPDNKRKQSSPKDKSPTRDVKIKQLYVAEKNVSSTDASVKDVETPITQVEKLKNSPRCCGTVSEELNLDIDSLPSVRTLKEIQYFLEQKCSLIRSRLHQESGLKTGETLSLRYKLSQPPLWQAAITEPPSEHSKTITLSPLKNYSSVKRPLSPLQKNKCQQIKNNPSLINNVQKSAKRSDKSLQVSLFENIPVARMDTCSTQCSIETSNKDIQEVKFNTPSLTSPKTVKQNSDFTSQICTQKDCINTDQKTNEALTDVNQFSNISTQINVFDYEKHPCPNKHVSFQIVTDQFSVIPNQNKETQVSPSSAEVMTKTPIKTKKVDKQPCKNDRTQTIICKEIIQNKPRQQEILYLQSNATQTTNLRNKYTTCNIENENIVEVVPPPVIKETKECCTQYSPVQQQDHDSTEYKTFNSFIKIDDERSPEHHRYRCRNKTKHPVPKRHKLCSTPVSTSSTTSQADTVSLSDGEVKLSCECSTSIGEIHLCRFANHIRKKVPILKRNPDQVLKGSFGGKNVKVKREHKYNENWYAYYVMKTESSSDHGGTGSNLSSIKSNTE